MTSLLAPDTWLTREAATAALNAAGIPTTPNSLDYLAGQGRGPKFSKVNGRAIYKRADLEAWIASHMTSDAA